MRNLKKQLLCLAMIIPMLVLLAHDVIPHHHHSQSHESEEVTPIFHKHIHVRARSCESHEHNGTYWNHRHNSGEESCCILTHNRVQNEMNYQVFLKADLVLFDVDAVQRVQKFQVHNFRLIPDLYLLSPLRRGPPGQRLV